MKFLPWIAITAFGTLLFVLWNQSNQLAAIQSELAIVKDVLKGEQGTEKVDAPAPSELRRHGEIDERLSKVPPNNSEAYANALAEVDEWVFHPDDDEIATEKLKEHVVRLRGNLITDVQNHLTAATKATSGKEAALSIYKAGFLFGLLPQPSTDNEKEEAQALSDLVSSTARRVEEIRRMRYNEWAALKIKDAFQGYYAYKKSFGDDDDDLINTFIANLGRVETSHLEPAVSGIYQQILSLTTDALAESKKLELAKKLSSPSLSRKTPFEF